MKLAQEKEAKGGKKEEKKVYTAPGKPKSRHLKEKDVEDGTIIDLV